MPGRGYRIATTIVSYAYLIGLALVVLQALRGRPIGNTPTALSTLFFVSTLVIESLRRRALKGTGGEPQALASENLRSGKVVWGLGALLVGGLLLLECYGLGAIIVEQTQKHTLTTVGYVVVGVYLLVMAGTAWLTKWLVQRTLSAETPQGVFVAER